jgi:hypothetical protein
MSNIIEKKVIFKSKKGIIFERTDFKNRSRVNVRSGDYNHRIYRFNNTHGTEFESPYVSWENLNCCNGWQYEEEYLKTAVQENKKICAGISFDNKEELNDYIENLDREKYDYIDVSWDNGLYRFHLIDLVRKGSLSDYYDLKEVFKFYKLMGLDWDYVDSDRFDEFFQADLFDLINGDKDYKYSDIDKDLAETIITGLLLGYPLETTASIIFQ